MKNNLINIDLTQEAKQPFYKSAMNAANGIVDFFQTERNGKIQLFVASITIACGFVFKISADEWLAILMCIAAVFSLEMINTALEVVCDLISTEYHPSIKKIKDIAAGAVLVMASASIVIAAIIFLPKILAFYEIHQIK